MTSPPESARGAPILRPADLWLALLVVSALAIAQLAVALVDPAPLATALTTGPAPTTLLEHGARVDAWVAAGEWGALSTASLVHRSGAHLLANGLWLLLALTVAVRLAGTSAAAAACLLGGLAGHTASAALSLGPSVGASAMAYGVTGLLVAALWPLLPRTRRPALALLTVALLALPLLSGPSTDHLAHLGGLLTGLTTGFLRLRVPRAPDALALAAIALTLAPAFSALLGLSGVLPPMQAAHATRLDLAALPLPAEGLAGRYHSGRCDAAPSASGPACVVQNIELLAVAGTVTELAAADAAVARHMPPPGRCIRYSEEGESVLLLRDDAGHALALAALSWRWARFRSLRHALSGGRCPGS